MKIILLQVIKPEQNKYQSSRTTPNQTLRITRIQYFLKLSKVVIESRFLAPFKKKRAFRNHH